MTELELEHYFQYHPVMTSERKAAHDEINAAALVFAKAIFENTKNDRYRQLAFDAIQFAKMSANQGATLDELGIK